MTGDEWSWLIAIVLCALAFGIATISRRRAAKRKPRDEKDDR